MAIRLKQAGIHTFTVFESSDGIGGTWRKNSYPGLACDVPSRFYQFSFALRAGWTQRFPLGLEVLRYLECVAAEYGILPHIRLNCPVTGVRHKEGMWRLELGGGHHATADFLVCASGFLDRPRSPDIPGITDFAGPVLHTARWAPGTELNNMRVAVVGTGSSGVQITSALAGQVKQLLLCQRSAPWIYPIRNRPYKVLTRQVFENVRAMRRLAYRYHDFRYSHLLYTALVRPGLARRVVEYTCKRQLRKISDPELRRILTPDYRPMCKRIVMSTEFYDVVQRDNIEVITDTVARVTQKGLVMEGGAVREIDALVFATGFDSHRYCLDVGVIGPFGNDLESAWRSGPRAYRTIAVPGFPNLFIMNGPYSPFGTYPGTVLAEIQSGFILACVARWGSSRALLAPSEAAARRFHDELKRALPRTAWASGCSSWYIGKEGFPELWPWSPGRYRQMLKEPDMADFEQV
jgi:cation diffusion facilitator CzcD-associated flavoprotein CzcO